MLPPFQSHQKWLQGCGKNEVQFTKQAAETFLGHGRCFCLGAKMFSFEITKQLRRRLGDFVLLVIWATHICICVCKLPWKMHIIYLF